MCEGVSDPCRTRALADTYEDNTTHGDPGDFEYTVQEIYNHFARGGSWSDAVSNAEAAGLDLNRFMSRWGDDRDRVIDIDAYCAGNLEAPHHDFDRHGRALAYVLRFANEGIRCLDELLLIVIITSLIVCLWVEH